jgi:hypothetical protein
VDIQGVLDTLRVSDDDPLWANARNAWIRSLAPTQVGKIGEALALRVLGGKPTQNNTVGYDIDLNGKRIEVKLSTVVMNDGRPILIWRQLRPSDPYTHICFVAVYPDHTRMFLVPREVIPSDVPKRQHGRAQSLEIFQIHARKINELFPWMVAHEIKLPANNSMHSPARETGARDAGR